MILETDNPDDITLPVYEDALPVDIQHLDEGAREIYDIVLRMFVALQRASGLPLDYIRMTQSLPQLLRKTKMVQIQEAFPEFSEEIHKVLHTMDVESIDEMVDSFVDPTLYQSTRSKFQKIYKNFLQDLQKQWVYLLAWWICDLQNQVFASDLTIPDMERFSSMYPDMESVWGSNGRVKTQERRGSSLPCMCCL